MNKPRLRFELFPFSASSQCCGGAVFVFEWNGDRNLWKIKAVSS
jgi:hypothetical protein